MSAYVLPPRPRAPGRRRDQIKALVLAATAVGVCTAPLWSFAVFMTVCGIVAAAVGVIAFGMFLNIYVGFRVWESAIDRIARSYLARPRSLRRLLPARLVRAIWR